MTDARFPERWLNDRRVVRLSDAGFRLFVTSLTYMVANRTDGAIDKADLALLPNVDLIYVTELMEAGLMESSGSESYFSTVYRHSQSSKAYLDSCDNKREHDRRRQANKRARDNGQPEPYPKHGRDGSRDVTPDITRDSLGQDRPGQARTGAYEGDQQDAANVTSQPPSGSSSSPVRSGSPPPRKCKHGEMNGDQPDPWLKGRMACPECAAQSQPEGEAS